ncbi:coat protein [ssRNA phage Zoerhiza.4_26]|uniref:Coat protein n=2 Tax=Leviviricetes TaxID=2842243 RepID=A0A8S5KYS1_9VIRU|nr:coat protein [ssRNA phage Zoerhiza.4_26]QDH90889.1 MAG: hypothetical protein H4Rhizo45528_000002 [Leviviridae sp.]DAD50295.1 TPA_asm: coat protein [ssRNA phage Zoerhiza.4_26]
MSLAASLTLKNEAASNRTFVETIVQPNGRTRLDSATSLQTPTKLVISHSTSGTGDGLVDRHLIQATRVELDSNGVPFTTIVNLTIAVPRKSTSNTTVYDLVSFIKDLIDTGGVKSADLDAILLGQS